MTGDVSGRGISATALTEVELGSRTLSFGSLPSIHSADWGAAIRGLLLSVEDGSTYDPSSSQTINIASSIPVSMSATANKISLWQASNQAM